MAYPVPSPSPEEDAVRIDQQIEQVRFAERLGFGDNEAVKYVLATGVALWLAGAGE